MADRLGALRTLGLLALAQIAVLPLFAFLPLPVPALLLLLFVWSLAGWSFMAAQQIRLLSLVPEASVVLALNAAAIYVGAALGSAVGGAVLDVAGLLWLGPAAAVAALLALGHLAVSHRGARSAGREARLSDRGPDGAAPLGPSGKPPHL
jgi:predicted MFS family arabinose efflux permease